MQTWWMTKTAMTLRWAPVPMGGDLMACLDSLMLGTVSSLYSYQILFPSPQGLMARSRQAQSTPLTLCLIGTLLD